MDHNPKQVPKRPILRGLGSIKGKNFGFSRKAGEKCSQY
jgi:hypothetical protein